SVSVVGWAMLISGLCMNMIHQVWKVEVQDWSLITMLVLAFTILFVTTIAFWMFIKSLEYLEEKETTLLGTVEPLYAVVSSVISVILLNLPFGFLQFVGMILILLMVVYLSLARK